MPRLERIVLTVSPDFGGRLDRLAEKLEADRSYAIRQALQLLEYVVKVTEEGGRVISFEADGTEKPLLKKISPEAE